MKFKPKPTASDLSTWVSEEGWYSITAHQNGDILISAKGSDNWERSMPFNLAVADEEVIGFVVRGIIDALAPVLDVPGTEDADKAVQGYLDKLAPKRFISSEVMQVGSWLDSVVKNMQGRQTTNYEIDRNDVLHYMKRHG